jgi:hypothetical protein
MFRTLNILFFITVIQFWWIAIWGLAYIFIGSVAGKSKKIEMYIYVGMMILTAFLIQSNPDMLERL